MATNNTNIDQHSTISVLFVAIDLNFDGHHSAFFFCVAHTMTSRETYTFTGFSANHNSFNSDIGRDLPISQIKKVGFLSALLKGK